MPEIKYYLRILGTQGSNGVMMRTNGLPSKSQLEGRLRFSLTNNDYSNMLLGYAKVVPNGQGHYHTYFITQEVE